MRSRSASNNGLGKVLRGVAYVTLALIIALGLWFRVSAVDRKYFWLDEVHAAMLRGGHSELDVMALFDNQARPLDDLQQFVHVDPSQTYADTALTLARNHPVHPPLYYCALQVWTRAFGDSIAATRALSICFSLLCFPAVYWLARELFFSRTAAWTAVALWAVSPLEVLYAQEAKQYSLFAATVLTATAALLWALRRPSVRSWGCFAVAVSLGLYTHLLFAPVLAAFTTAVVFSRVGRLRSRRTWQMWKGYFAALLVGFATFVPWVVTCLQVGERGEQIAREHMSQAQPFAWLAAAWISNVGCVFADLGNPGSTAAASLHVAVWLAVLGISAYAFVNTIRRSSRCTWMILLLLATVPALTMIVPDLVLGGGRSMLVRYWTASSIGILLAVAGALGRLLASSNGYSRFAGSATFASLVVVGAISCARSADADFWWNKNGVVNNHRNAAAEHGYVRQALTIIGHSEKPLIVTELGAFQECELIAFSYYLHNSQVQWLGTRNPADANLPTDRTIFLYEAPTTAKYLYEQGWKLRRLDPQGLFVHARKEAIPNTAGVTRADSQ